MSRSGYSDDFNDTEGQWALIRWRGAVASAIRGRLGQAFLREILGALDAMPEKRLAATRFESGGDCCTLGAVCRARGVDASALTPDDNADNVSEEIATMLGIPRALAAEIMYENDESLTAGEWHAVPRSDLELVPHWQVPSILVRDPLVDERRWRYMRNWVASQIKETA